MTQQKTPQTPEVARIMAQLESAGAPVSASMTAAIEQSISAAVAQSVPYISVWHDRFRVNRCDCQTATLYVSLPTDVTSFYGWIKYFVGNSMVIDPDLMKKPAIPQAFCCRDTRFPEVVKEVSLSSGQYFNQSISYSIPGHVEESFYFGNVALIGSSSPYPTFVTGNYAPFEIIACLDVPTICTCQKCQK